MSCIFMSGIFMSCNFMPCSFDGPSFSCPSYVQSTPKINDHEQPIQGLPKVLKYPLSQERAKLRTYFKFGRYIHKVHRNKRPLRILEKRSVGIFRDSPVFWSTPYYLRNGKATNFKFSTHFNTIDRNKSPLTIREK